MYKFQSSLVLNTNGWEDKDVSTETFHALYLTYKKVYLTLLDDVSDTLWSLDLDVLKHEKQFDKKTINEYLLENGNYVISGLSKELKNIKSIRRMVYHDHSHNTVKMRPIKKGNGFNQKRVGYLTPDLEIETEGFTDQSCMVSVNGLLHRVESINDKHYVIGGYKTMLNNQMSEYGIYDFTDIGVLKTLPITEDNLFSVGYGYEVKLPIVVDREDHVFLSLNGLLFLLGEGTYLANDMVLGIKKRYFNWTDIVFNTRESLDTKLSLSTLDSRERFILSEMYDEKIQRELLTSDNSFVVVLKAYDTSQPIALQKERFYDNGFGSGVYRGYYPPNGIMRNDVKQVASYVNTLGDDEVIIRTNQGSIPEYVYKTSSTRNIRFPENVYASTWEGQIPNPVTDPLDNTKFWYTWGQAENHPIYPTDNVCLGAVIDSMLWSGFNPSFPDRPAFFSLSLYKEDFIPYDDNNLISLDALGFGKIDIRLRCGNDVVKITFTKEQHARVVDGEWVSLALSSNNEDSLEGRFANFYNKHSDRLNEIIIGMDFYLEKIPPTKYLDHYVDKTVDLTKGGWRPSVLTCLNYYQLK